MDTQDELAPCIKYIAAYGTQKMIKFWIGCYEHKSWNYTLWQLEDLSTPKLRVGLHQNWKGMDVPEGWHWWRILVQTRVGLIPFDITSGGDPSSIHPTSLARHSFHHHAQTRPTAPGKHVWRLHPWWWWWLHSIWTLEQWTTLGSGFVRSRSAILSTCQHCRVQCRGSL
jgi:hypothetical protein